jgi:hypothetical protein
MPGMRLIIYRTQNQENDKNIFITSGTYIGWEWEDAFKASSQIKKRAFGMTLLYFRPSLL